MFKIIKNWLDKAQLREREKLLFQNGAAAKVLQKLAVTTEEKQLATTYENENRRIALISGAISPDDLKKLLEMNSQLRLMYDKTALRRVSGESFDAKFKPMMGWKAYYLDRVG